MHLAYQGILVAIGDEIQEGQPIGIVGMSGFTTTPHLHFNVLQPSSQNWESTAVDFKENYSGSQLTEGQWVKK